MKKGTFPGRIAVLIVLVLALSCSIVHADIDWADKGAVTPDRAVAGLVVLLAVTGLVGMLRASSRR